MMATVRTQISGYFGPAISSGIYHSGALNGSVSAVVTTVSPSVLSAYSTTRWVHLFELFRLKALSVLAIIYALW